MKSWFYITAFIAACIVHSHATAADVPSSTAPVAGDLDAHYSVGYFLPHEGDIDGGAAAGLGFNYALGTEMVFGEVLFSNTGQDGSRWITDVDHLIVQAGYMAPCSVLENLKLGAGVQVHHMEYNGIDAKATRTTAFGLAEYELSDRWAARMQYSAMVAKNNVRFGGAALLFLFRP